MRMRRIYQFFVISALVSVALIGAGCVESSERYKAENYVGALSNADSDTSIVEGVYERPQITTPDEAWAELMRGNRRFVEGKRSVRDFPTRRGELVSGQHPFATVITCSDSRVVPEILFDQGLGDLFVIREAGYVADPITLGSVEYGVHHLHTPLLVVLGHSKCGAVTAAVEGGAEGNIEHIMDMIEPAVETTSESGVTGPELVEITVNAHVKNTIKEILEKSPVTKELVEKGELQIIGAKYYIDTGEVKVIE